MECNFKKIKITSAGRPARVDPVGIATGFLTIINAKENNKHMKKSECKKMVVDLARQSDVRKGFSGLDFSISKTTVNSVYNATNITFEKGQVTTVPRDRETRDIRNFVGQVALNEALAKDLDPHMIANWDATSFGVDDDNIELLATVKEEGDKPLTLVENSKFEMGVKWFALMNANGNLGKDVFVIGNACDASNLFKATKANVKHSDDYVDKSLQTNVFNCITKNCANMTIQKREQLADGLVGISKGLKKSVNGAIIQHGFNRTGLYPLDHKRCLSNCHKLTIERLGHQKIVDILEKIPDIANLYLSESGGQIKEEEFDACGIPAIETMIEEQCSNMKGV
jgi:hypothetical protein